MDWTDLLRCRLHLRQERRVVLSVLVDSSKKRKDVESCWWLELPRVNGCREFICHDQAFTRYYTSPAVHHQNALFRLVIQSYLTLILLRVNAGPLNNTVEGLMTCLSRTPHCTSMDDPASVTSRSIQLSLRLPDAMPHHCYNSPKSAFLVSGTCELNERRGVQWHTLFDTRPLRVHREDDFGSMFAAALHKCNLSSTLVRTQRRARRIENARA